MKWYEKQWKVNVNSITFKNTYAVTLSEHLNML